MLNKTLLHARGLEDRTFCALLVFGRVVVGDVVDGRRLWLALCTGRLGCLWSVCSLLFAIWVRVLGRVRCSQE